MLGSLLLGFNVQASFQKLYSKKKLGKSINFVCLIILTSSAIFFTLICWGLSWSGIFKGIFSDSQHIPNAILVYLYAFSFAFAAIITPILNAKRKTFLYGLSTTLPVFTSVSCIVLIDVKDINDLLLIQASSNLIMLTSILFCNLNALSINSYSSKHVIKISRYILGYTWLSLPTLGSRYLIDLVARSILLSSKGELAVAILTFSTSLFAVFRSLEQGFFRAITPFLMVSDSEKNEQLALTKRLILLQSLFTVMFFLLSPFWLDILKTIFISKPTEVFVPVVLILMAFNTVVSYVKNYYLSRAKKNASSLRKFFVITIAGNLLILLSISIIDLSTINFVLIQLIFAALNLGLIKLLIKF